MSESGRIRIPTESPIDWARAHPSFFLRPDAPIRDQIERQLVDGARAVGATDIALIRLGAWSVLGSTRDWFRERRVPLDHATGSRRPKRCWRRCGSIPPGCEASPSP